MNIYQNQTNYTEDTNQDDNTESPEINNEEIKEAMSPGNDDIKSGVHSQKRKSPAKRKQVSPFDQLLRADERVNQLDFNSEFDCRNYLDELVNKLGIPILRGELKSADEEIQEVLLTLGAIAFKSKK